MPTGVGPHHSLANACAGPQGGIASLSGIATEREQLVAVPALTLY